MVDRAGFRKRVLLDLINAPLVLMPPAIGITMTLAAWATGNFVELGSFIGLAGCALGFGSLATRWLTRHDEVTEDVFRKMIEETKQERDARLDKLADDLATDEDPRTCSALRNLRVLQKTLDEIREDTATIKQVDSAEVIRNSQGLIQHCVQSLERSFELWKTAQSMLTSDAHKTLIEKREVLVMEIDQSIEQVAHAVDGIRTLGLEERPGRKLASIRAELDKNLQLARAVDKRMQSLEEELEDLISQTE